MGRQAEALVRTARPRPRAVQSPFSFLADTPADSEPVSLATVDAETFRDALAVWTSLGHAITIGRTSDGGAIAITLLASGHRTSKYFADLALFEDFLVSLRDASKHQ
jgi:hypothetical protein